MSCRIDNIWLKYLPDGDLMAIEKPFKSPVDVPGNGKYFWEVEAFSELKVLFLEISLRFPIDSTKT